MAVGMVTVFVILIIVILGSTGIIKILNKFAESDEISRESRSIIESAISEITSGKGKITKISRI